MPRRDAAPRSIGALPTGCGGGPAGAEELLAGGDQVVGAGAHPLGVEHEDVAVGREQLDEHLHLVDEDGRERLHPLDGHALGELVGDLGELRVLLAELGGAAAYVVGEQQLAARRRPQPLALAPSCAGRPPRSCGSRRSRRRRTPRAGGAPRSAGRRRRCRRGRRTRRASRPGRPGCRPHPTSRRTTSSSSTSWPGSSSTGSRSASPLTCGCSTERTGATTTLRGPLLASSARGA